MCKDHFNNANDIRVQVHVVRSPDDFPVEIRSLTKGLKRWKMDDVGTTADLSLERALKAAQSCSARARRLMRERETYANLESESTTHVVGLTPAYILEQCMPELQIHFQCDYSRGLYPCWRDDSSSRLLQPYGTMTSALSFPILFAIMDESKDAEASIGNDTAPSNRPRFLDPLLQAHFIRTKCGHDAIPFPVLFVALSDEIYELLESAVLYRRALGINTPCLAFVHDPLNCQLQAVWAWSIPHKDHPCVEVQVAHAPFSETSPELGVFDVQLKDSATALATYLRTIRTRLYIDAFTLQKNALTIQRTLLETPASYWRVDQNKYFHCRSVHTENITQWLCDIDPSPGTPSSPPSSWPSLEGEDVVMDATIRSNNEALAEARLALAQAEYALENWRSLHAGLVPVDPCDSSSFGLTRDSLAYLDPNVAVFCGIRVFRRTSHPSEFPDPENMPEPLKMGLGYVRRFLPLGCELPSVALDEVALPALPPEIVLKDETTTGIPLTLKMREDVAAYLNFRAAAQVENWIRTNLNLVPVEPLDPAMTAYLMDSISTFLKVTELCKRADAMPGKNATLYGECFDLLLGAHGDVTKVNKRLHQQISTARQRYFDEQHTLADEDLPIAYSWGLGSYPHINILKDYTDSLKRCIPLDSLTTPLGESAKKCFKSMLGNYEERGHAAREGHYDWAYNLLNFRESWKIKYDDKALSAAALRAVTFDTLMRLKMTYAHPSLLPSGDLSDKCSGILSTPSSTRFYPPRSPTKMPQRNSEYRIAHHVANRANVWTNPLP
ncbi:hypothetical protein CYLTODRAFT_113284 [Cylindrobasidium torrendii FP15055 ss-10]|uniref:Uncharacterized protein n=1 Tax=Cylindrobasidium torrendii FP15055 ss-10 TaxID=1314674 RepID=A0A0D7B0E4_9AGAR|nr:hypothetical protein CYLTODRAFT_113284 [Cylindrobasidium torrendii FP15055 ss-10]